MWALHVAAEEAYPVLRPMPAQGPNERICNAGAPGGIQGGLPCTPGRQECADICPSLQHGRPEAPADWVYLDWLSIWQLQQPCSSTPGGPVWLRGQQAVCAAKRQGELCTMRIH